MGIGEFLCAVFRFETAAEQLPHRQSFFHQSLTIADAVFGEGDFLGASIAGLIARVALSAPPNSQLHVCPFDPFSMDQVSMGR